MAGPFFDHPILNSCYETLPGARLSSQLDKKSIEHFWAAEIITLNPKKKYEQVDRSAGAHTFFRRWVTEGS